LSDANEAVINPGSEAAQQIVAEIELRDGSERGIDEVVGAVFAAIGFIHGKLGKTAGHEALLDKRVDAVRGVHKRRDLAEQRIYLRSGGMRPGAGILERWIEVRSYRSDLGDLSVGVASAATASASGEASALDGAVDALAGSHLIDEGIAGWNAAKSSACLGALDGPFGGEGAVTVDFEIEIVFDGESNGVLQRDVEMAGADEGVEAIRIDGARARDGGGAVRAPDERAFWAGDEGLLGEGGCSSEEEKNSREALPGLKPRLQAKACSTTIHCCFSWGIEEVWETWPALASSMEMRFTSSVRPIA